MKDSKHRTKKMKKTDRKEITLSFEEKEARRLAKKEQRRQEKAIKQLAELGLDENGQELDNYSLEKYPIREFKFTLPGFHNPVAFNPVVTLIGITSIWGIVTWISST
jgi:hypothetical protein